MTTSIIIVTKIMRPTHFNETQFRGFDKNMINNDKL